MLRVAIVADLSQCTTDYCAAGKRAYADNINFVLTARNNKVFVEGISRPLDVNLPADYAWTIGDLSTAPVQPKTYYGAPGCVVQ